MPTPKTTPIETATNSESCDILQVQGINSKGFGTIPKLVMQDRQLTACAKAIYAYFCSYAGAGKTAFPRRDKIIADLGLARDTYYRHFNMLRDNGYIKADQEHKNGRLSRNIYTILDVVPATKKNPEGDDLQCPKKQDTVFSDTVKQDTVFSDTNKRNISKSNSINNNSKDNTLSTSAHTREEKSALSGNGFSPPPAEDVELYVKSLGGLVDAQKFVDHYTAVGWKVNGSPVEDWQALVRKWAHQDKQRERQPAIVRGSNRHPAHAGKHGSPNQQEMDRMRGILDKIKENGGDMEDK